MKTHTIEIVVAKYQEDISWLSQLSPLIKRTVYDKGEAGASNSLPNIGRESHTYLHHIITRHEELSDLTIFSQGGSPEDAPALSSILNALANNLSAILAKEKFYMDLAPVIQEFSLNATWERDKKHETLGDLVKHLFDIQAEDKKYFSRGHAIFAVNKNNIFKHPISFYEKALKSVSHSIDPQEGHFMERLWKTLLSSPECYDVAQKPGEWREIIETDGVTVKRPIPFPFDEEVAGSLFVTQ